MSEMGSGGGYMFGDNETKRKVASVQMTCLRGCPQGLVQCRFEAVMFRGGKTGIHHAPSQLSRRRREQIYTTQTPIRTTAWLR